MFIYLPRNQKGLQKSSVLETGSCGLNLILSNMPQHREIFENCFEFIELFEVGMSKR